MKPHVITARKYILRQSSCKKSYLMHVCNMNGVLDVTYEMRFFVAVESDILKDIGNEH